MRTNDFDFDLPEELIAQRPAASRDQSRLLVLHRAIGKIEHCRFLDLLTYLRSGDVMVINDSKVIPARLRGINTETGSRFEIVLLEQVAPNDWWAMLRPGKRARLNTRITIVDHEKAETNLVATVIDINAEGHRRLKFDGTDDILDRLAELGETPLPPYIKRNAKEDLLLDVERYQTVFAKAPGSVAAPTAGLHFTSELLDRVRALGVNVCPVTLHVGLGTFAPVKAENLSEHILHEERFEIPQQTAEQINTAKAEARQVVAVGTTSLRVLESEGHAGNIKPGQSRTRLFVRPPFDFKTVDVLLTNFHLPRSTLLMLVSAFAAPGKTTGRDLILSAYAEAIRERYRFFSYGDAMLIL